MKLPSIGHTLTNPAPKNCTNSSIILQPVTDTNTVHAAKSANAMWFGNEFRITVGGHHNYRFIPDKRNKVSYCVVPGHGLGDDFWVISTQYGGCEYHELYHPDLNLLAFLHVYRGDGITVQYTLASGWELREIKESKFIAQKYGMKGSNWSVSHIDRSYNPPEVESKFIHVGGGSGPIKVTGEHSGDNVWEPFMVA